MKTYLILVFVSLLILQIIPDSQRDSSKITDSLTKQRPDLTNVKVDTIRKGNIDLLDKSQLVTARIQDFPTLHPIIVHFVISFIVIAALLQLINLLAFKKDIAWVVFFLVLVGFIAALLASQSFHPETTDLSQRASIVLGLHDEWAEWTIRTALAGMILQLIYIIMTKRRVIRTADGTPKIQFRRNRGLMLIVAVLLLISAYSVMRAGYYGVQMVHIEGVGPQGKYLETGTE